MSQVQPSRTLRPSTRQSDSPYKVDTEAVGEGDTLQLTIFDEDEGASPIAVFEFTGADLAERASTHFSAHRIDGNWELRFSGARPVAVKLGGVEK